MLPSFEILINRHQHAHHCSTNTRASTEALNAVSHWKNLVLAELKLEHGGKGLVLKANQKCIVYLGDTEIMRWNAMFQNIDVARLGDVNFTIITKPSGEQEEEVEIFQVVGGVISNVAQAEERPYS